VHAGKKASVLVAVCVAALCMCGPIRMHASESKAFDVFISLQVDRAIAPQVHLRDLMDEADGLWAPYGVRLNWADQQTLNADAFSVAATVGRQIDGPSLPPWMSVLGRTTISLEPPSHRPIFLSFDATEKLLDVRRATGQSSVRVVRDQEMARALGRVLAHEIGHLLLAAPYHDMSGLMRQSFAPGDLAAPERAPFRLACASVDRLRSRIRVLSGLSPAASDDDVMMDRSEPSAALTGGRAEPALCTTNGTGRSRGSDH
jgi:hypothetical protein